MGKISHCFSSLLHNHTKEGKISDIWRINQLCQDKELTFHAKIQLGCDVSNQLYQDFNLLKILSAVHFQTHLEYLKAKRNTDDGKVAKQFMQKIASGSKCRQHLL